MNRRFRRPESVLVVVYSADGLALVMRRADQPELWQSVTGSLGWDETPQQAATRELREETGIEADPVASELTRRFEILDPWRDRYEPGTQWNVEHEFTVRLKAPRTILMNPKEHLAYLWLPIEQAVQRVFSWTNQEALETLI